MSSIILVGMFSVETIQQVIDLCRDEAWQVGALFHIRRGGDVLVGSSSAQCLLEEQDARPVVGGGRGGVAEGCSGT